MNIPDSVYIKRTWKFWKWFKKPVRIPMVKELKGEPTFIYRIFTADGVTYVERKKSDKILCSKCFKPFIETDIKDQYEYSKLVTHLYECPECHGRISVGIVPTEWIKNIPFEKHTILYKNT